MKVKCIEAAPITLDGIVVNVAARLVEEDGKGRTGDAKLLCPPGWGIEAGKEYELTLKLAK